MQSKQSKPVSLVKTFLIPPHDRGPFATGLHSGVRLDLRTCFLASAVQVESLFQHKFPGAFPFVTVTHSASEGAPRPWVRPGLGAFSGFRCPHTPASRPQSTDPGL